MITESAARLDDLTHWAPPASCASLHMLRLDLVHPVVSGNKWFKLKGNAKAAIATGKSALLTFGGPYSNHLLATAYAAKEWGLRSVGIVRGQSTSARPTRTLQTCISYGMQLEPISKAEYAVVSHAKITEAYPDAYIVPEGGANDQGVRGASEIARFIPAATTDVGVSIGTSTTLRGLLSAVPAGVRVHGFYVARDIERMEPLLRAVQASKGPQLHVHSVLDPRFGRWKPDALRFIRDFASLTNIPLDVVYTSKMMMKVEELLNSGFFGASRHVVCIHTGGLQGNPDGLFNPGVALRARME